MLNKFNKQHTNYRSKINSLRLARHCFLLLIAVALVACSEKAIQPQEKPTVEPYQGGNSLPSVVTDVVRPQQQLQYQVGIEAMKNGELTKAQRIFREFIRTNPTLSGAYTNLALIHFEKKENKKSLKLVTRAIELNSKQPEAFNLRAQLSIIDGKIKQAKTDYLTAIQLKPDYANAQYNLALLYDIYLQEIAPAVKHYEMYLSLIKYPDEATQEWVDQLKRTLANG